MNDEGASESSSREFTSCCLNLRHKMMFLDSSQSTPGMVDDSSDTRVFWCTKTQEVLGPDGLPVSPGECATMRECYCGE